MSYEPSAIYPEKAGKGIRTTCGMAIASLAFGISSFMCFMFTGLVGVILGVIALSKISGSNGRLGGKGLAVAGIVTGAMGCVWTLIAPALMLPAIQQVRVAARRVHVMNNVRQITLANLIHESEYRRLGSNVSEKLRDAGENLSWRVHLLPHLGEDELYSQFRLDEPWDSAHNKLLIANMPSVYDHPQLILPEGHTVYQFPVSPADSESPALYVEGEPGVTFADITDGSVNTVMVVVVSESAAVPWTKPQDWEFDPDAPLRDLGGAFPGGFIVGMCDGSTNFLEYETDPYTVKAIITRSAHD